MKITTKTGDKGLTGLFGGRRVSKGSLYMDALGGLDELQSMIGWARCCISDSKSINILKRAQDDIYRIMGIIGFEMKCPKTIENIKEKDVEFLEEEIEARQRVVQNLSEFIRPGENEASARLHVVSSICRRAERKLVALGKETSIPESLLKYLNRLSDLLFLLEREIA